MSQTTPGATKSGRPSEEEMWAGPSGQLWLANALRFEETLRPLGDALLDRAGLAPGESVIDVGCGAGSMSLQIAQRVAPGGSVTGLDISPELVAEATRRASAEKPGASIKFVLGDAAKANLPQADCLISRFGIMFFTDPYGAFAHLRTLIRAGGRLAIATWAPLKENPWMMEMRTVISHHFEVKTPPPRTPGPFAFDEPAYMKDILTKAGFQQIDIAPWQTQMHVGGPNSNPESAAGFLLKALSIAQRALDAPEEVRTRVQAELIERLRPHLTPTGVRMHASIFLVTARA